MKKYLIIFCAFILILSISTIGVSSCTVSQKIQDKTGTQLWGENCGRCHNAPGPGEFSAANWDIIGRHMRVRAQVTETEERKIIEYLKGSVN
ncbi:MAG: cytochrome c [Chitinophagaceae bacterium]|nr:MAG: cytochrome c [Chitinophagaceae bacterium]